MIHVTVNGEQSVTQAFATLTADVGLLVDKLAVKLHAEVLDRVDLHTHQARPGDTRKPGALLQSVQMERIPGGWLIDHDRQRAPHAPYVHWGTRPHVIKPRKKKALRWVVGNEFVFAKSVRHPGNAPDTWMIDTANTAPGHVAALLREFK